MTLTTLGWEIEVDRGPDWLFVRLIPTNNTSSYTSEFVEPVWDVIDQHFIYRIVLEMDQLDQVSSELIDQLLILQQRVWAHQGMLRLCGLSPDCFEARASVLSAAGLTNYRDRETAVLGRKAVAR